MIVENEEINLASFLADFSSVMGFRAQENRINFISTALTALTAHAIKEEQERAASSGFTDFLSKPVQKQALINAIRGPAHHSGLNSLQ